MALFFPHPEAPAAKQALQLHPDIKWLRSPLPYSLDHINCYLLRDGDGWCIVDTGMNNDAARQNWLDVIEAELEGAPITRVFVTHHHPDHVGLAGWLCDSRRIRLFMTQTEYLYAAAFGGAPRSQPFWEASAYFDENGIADSDRKIILGNTDYTHLVSELPGSFHQLLDKETIKIGSHHWEAITTGGHAPEHLCLYCADLDILISGDQVLPGITSNVSVTPIQPTANPLQHWLDAHAEVAARVPDSVLVLPAHQLPFTGLHERLNAVVEHHHERLDALQALCDQPRTAQQLTTRLFKRELDTFQNFMAVGECVAHLHYLLHQKRINRVLTDGVYWYRQC